MLTLGDALLCLLLPLCGGGVILTLITEQFSDRTRFIIADLLILVMVIAVIGLM